MFANLNKIFKCTVVAHKQASTQQASKYSTEFSFQLFLNKNSAQNFSKISTVIDSLDFHLARLIYNLHCFLFFQLGSFRTARPKSFNKKIQEFHHRYKAETIAKKKRKHQQSGNPDST